MDHRFAYKTSADKFVDDDYEYSGKVQSYKEKVYNHSNNYENSEVIYKNNNKNYKIREEKQSDKGHKNSDEKDYIDIDEIYKNNDKSIVTKLIHTKVKAIVIVKESTVIKFINTVKKVLFLMTI